MHFDAPYIDEVANLSDTMRQLLFQLVWEPRQKTRLERSTMEAALIRVCQGHFVSISAPANIARRDEQSIRQQYLKRLVEAGKLRLASRNIKRTRGRAISPPPSIQRQHHQVHHENTDD